MKLDRKGKGIEDNLVPNNNGGKGKQNNNNEMSEDLAVVLEEKVQSPSISKPNEKPANARRGGGIGANSDEEQVKCEETASVEKKWESEP